MIESISPLIVLVGLLIGSYTDFMTREVPDWLNFALMGIGFGLAVLASFIYASYSYLIEAVAGFVLTLGIALLMFYTGQWGGGDSKMIMALGALLGLDIFHLEYLDYSLISFLFNALVVGAAYGVLWSVYLSIKHRKKFMKEFRKLSGRKEMKPVALITFLVFALAFFTQNLFFQIILILGGSIGLLYLLWHIIKVIETACMHKFVSPQKLTEGDWIATEVMVNRKYIAGPKDLGITKKQIRQLVRLGVSQVKIKEGIPFVPSFLLAFVVTWMYGNVLFLFV